MYFDAKNVCQSMNMLGNNIISIVYQIFNNRRVLKRIM